MHARARARSTSSCARSWRSQLRPSYDELGRSSAVGGYGRGELHPHSDIDILVLVPDAPDDAGRGDGRTLRHLPVGHRARSRPQRAHASTSAPRKAPPTSACMTTLIEARLLAGTAQLFAAMRAARVAPTASGRCSEFFEAKVREQTERHRKANDTAYNLEPNVKTGPGGLRDIQTIAGRAAPLGSRSATSARVARRARDARLPDAARAAQARSRRRRSCGRCASACTCSPAGARTGCCSITRSGSRRCSATRTRPTRSRSSSSCSATTARSWTSACSTKCCCSCSARRSSPRRRRRVPLNRALPGPQRLSRGGQRRRVRAHAVGAARAVRAAAAEPASCAACAPRPSAPSTQQPVADRRGVPPEPAQSPAVPRDPARAGRRDARAAAHEHVRRARPLHPGVRPHRRPHAVRPVPRVHGRRAHAVRRRATCAGWRCRATTTSCPSCRAIMQPLPKPEIAYLAALFHDIAKGRGGDHSELGAVDAEAFCLEQGLSRYDARLVAWLVRNHLRAVGHRAEEGHLRDPEGRSTSSRARSATRRTSTISTC